MKGLICLIVCVVLVAGAAPSQAALVGVAFGGNGGSGFGGGGTAPTNWSSMGNGSLNNLIDETGAPTAIDIAVSGAFDSLGFAINPASIPIHVPSLSVLNGNLFAAPNTSINVTLSDLLPNTSYDLYVLAARSSVGLNNDVVTVTGAGAPVGFQQIGATDFLFINSQPGSSAQNLTDFAIQIISSATGTITISAKNTSNAGVLTGIAIAPSAAAAIIPEPTSMILLGLGAATLLRRRARAA